MYSYSSAKHLIIGKFIRCSTFKRWEPYLNCLYIIAERIHSILAFCLGHNFRFEGTNNHWTQAHLKWLKSLKLEGLYKKILEEYLLTFDTLTDKLERLDKRIEELSSCEAYKENVHKLSCFIGVKTITALAVLTEVGDFKRFSSAKHFASFLDLTPGEGSNGDDQNRLSITKAGNRHLRMLCL